VVSCAAFMVRRGRNAEWNNREGEILNKLKLADELEEAISDIEDSMTPYLGHDESATKAIEKVKDIADKLRR